MRLASFDIFDTTLLRRCGKPEAVWQILGKRLYPNDHDLCEAFVAWRRRAKGETLNEIYANLNSAFPAFAKKSVEEMMLAEEGVEEEMLTPYPSVCKLIEQRRQEGYHIAFISDMYLSSRFLRQVLEHCGCCQAEDHIFVSCEHNARKDTGKLYDVVRKQLHPKEWIHYGDNKRSDIKMARRKGIRAIHVNTSYNDVEKVYAQVSPSIAAFSRLYRLQHKKNEFATFAADYVAPAYLPYVIYVLREARRMGIRKLYFLSRDSYILLKTAQALTDEAKGLELHYLFVSRRSLLLPFLYGEDEKAYLAASDRHTAIGYDNIDKRLLHLGTTREELQHQFGIEFDYDIIQSKVEQDDFLEKVFHSSFTPLLQKRARKQYELISRYFFQEGLLGYELAAAVDIGWLGTSRLMINRILNRLNSREIHFFYFGVRDDVFPLSAGRYSAFFQVSQLPQGISTLLEHYYSASPNLSTIGYRHNTASLVEPVFSCENNDINTRISQANTNATVDIGRLLMSNGNITLKELRACAQHSIEYVLSAHNRIDYTQLSRIGNFDDNQPFVRKLSVFELIHLVFIGKSITAFDLASLSLTVPHWIMVTFWRIRLFAGQIRRYIFVKYKSHEK